MCTAPHDSVTAAAYDRVAVSYAETLPDDGYESFLDRAMINDFTTRVRSTAGCRVLDAGCGAGRLAPVLAGHGLHYLGVDLSPAMVRTANDRHPGHRFLVGMLAKLPVPDASADGLLAWYSIIHTPRRSLDAVFAEFQRVLTPDGFVLLGFQVGDGERSIRRAYGHDVDLTAHLHDPASVRRQLEVAGFVVEAALTRAPRDTERHDQAVLLARRR